MNHVHYNEHMFNNVNVLNSSFSLLIQTPAQRILSLLAMNPGRSFYTREISKELNISLGSAHSVLLSLENLRLLTPEFIGRTKIHRLASLSPAIQVFRVLNTILILEALTSDLENISRRVVLFGSYARGTFSQGSDLDLLVVAEDKARATELMESAKRKNGFDLRPLIMNQLEWMDLEQNNPAFFDELSHGITLWERPVEESRL